MASRRFFFGGGERCRAFGRAGVLRRSSGPLSVRLTYLPKQALFRDRQAPPPSGRPTLAFICSAVKDSITNSTRSGSCLAHSCPLYSRQAAVRCGNGGSPCSPPLASLRSAYARIFRFVGPLPPVLISRSAKNHSPNDFCLRCSRPRLALLAALSLTYPTNVLPSSILTLPAHISSTDSGSIFHSACSITLFCSISGVSPSRTSTALCITIGPPSGISFTI